MQPVDRSTGAAAAGPTTGIDTGLQEERSRQRVRAEALASSEMQEIRGQHVDLLRQQAAFARANPHLGPPGMAEMLEAQAGADTARALSHLHRVIDTPAVQDLMAAVGAAEVVDSQNPARGRIGIAWVLAPLERAGQASDDNMRLLFGEPGDVRGFLLELRLMQTAQPGSAAAAMTAGMTQTGRQSSFQATDVSQSESNSMGLHDGRHSGEAIDCTECFFCGKPGACVGRRITCGSNGKRCGPRMYCAVCRRDVDVRL
jgi:hypothetical protein